MLNLDWLGPIDIALMKRRCSERCACHSAAVSLLKRRRRPAATSLASTPRSPSRRWCTALVPSYAGQQARRRPGTRPFSPASRPSLPAIAEPELWSTALAPGERIELRRGTPLGRPAGPGPTRTSAWTRCSRTSWTCLHVDGNAYWRKLLFRHVRGTGNVVELGRSRQACIVPTTEQGILQAFVDFLPLLVHGVASTSTCHLSDVVHFRYGLDDRDHRLGCSPLRRRGLEISPRTTRRPATPISAAGEPRDQRPPRPWSSTRTRRRSTRRRPTKLKARVTAAYGGDNVGSNGRACWARN